MKIQNKMKLIKAVMLLATFGVVVGVAGMAWLGLYLGPHAGWISEEFLWWHLRIFPLAIGSCIVGRAAAFVGRETASRELERLTNK